MCFVLLLKVSLPLCILLPMLCLPLCAHRIVGALPLCVSFPPPPAYRIVGEMRVT